MRPVGPVKPGCGVGDLPLMISETRPGPGWLGHVLQVIARRPRVPAQGVRGCGNLVNREGRAPQPLNRDDTGEARGTLPDALRASWGAGRRARTGRAARCGGGPGWIRLRH